MKEYYRIGETASLMGITTQTLRFYDKIGLVKPVKIDPRTVSGFAAGPYGAYWADGSEYRGNYGIADEQLKEFHKRRVELLYEAGADIILFETVPSLKEAKVEAEIAECAKTFAKGYTHLKMIGVNCTKPEYIVGLIHKIKENCDIPIGVYPNSGEEYDAVKKVWFGKQSALSFDQYAYNYMKAGASAVGGCCTTVAKHVEDVVRAKKRFCEEQK